VRDVVYLQSGVHITGLRYVDMTGLVALDELQAQQQSALE